MNDTAAPHRLVRLLELWVPLALVGAAVAASILALPHLPDRVPTRWGLDGEPTNLMPRGFAAFVLPGFTLYTWFLMWAIGWAVRHTPEGRAMPAWVMPAVTAGTVAFMLVAHLAILANGLGWAVRVPLVANLGIGALLAGIGFIMRNIPPNPVFGVRTPTTLRDENAWREANRVGGWAMVAAGSATMLAAPLPGAWPLAVLLGSTLLAGAAAVVAGRRAARLESQDG